MINHRHFRPSYLPVILPVFAAIILVCFVPAVNADDQPGKNISKSGYRRLPGYQKDNEIKVDSKIKIKWNLIKILWDPNAEINVNKKVEFGASVDISGDFAIVGSPNTGLCYNSSGTFDIYYNFENADNWEQINGHSPPLPDMKSEIWGFGRSVSISGDYAIVGCDYVRDSKRGVGAYIYYRSPANYSGFSLLKKLPSIYGGSKHHGFGKSVAISGEYAIVGDPEGGTGSYFNNGEAYVFYRDQGGLNNWGLKEKLSPWEGDYMDSFGCSVAISGNYAIVGACDDDDKGEMSGSAYIYYRYRQGDVWGHYKKLLAPDGGRHDQFGHSVAISGDYAVVGAKYGDYYDRSGSVYVFYRNKGGIDNWGLVKKLTLPKFNGNLSWVNAVDISGEYIVVGGSCAAYLYYRDKGGIDKWGLVQKLSYKNVYGVSAGGGFGSSVAISGDYVIVGAPGEGTFSKGGTVYIFKTRGKKVR